MSKPTAPLFRTHPLTGAPIEPIGRRPDGSPLWPIMGGAPEPPAPPTNQPPAATPPADQPPAGGTPPATPPATQPPAADQPPTGDAPDLSKLTADQLKAAPAFQAELNRIVGERLTREKQTWQEKLEEEKRRAGLDEAGKMQAQIDDERKSADEARQREQAAYQLAARTKAEVLAIAEGGRADRAAAIVAQADLTGAVDESGNVSDAVVRSAVTKVLESYPEWKGNATPPTSGGELPPGGGGPGASFTQSQVEAMSTEERVQRLPEIEKAMAEGRFVYGR